MISLDTSVVVCFLTRDDEAQFRAAQSVIQAARRAQEQLFIGVPVLLETVWVLQRAYGVDRNGVAKTIHGLLESSDLILEHEALVEAALDAFQTGSADFADYEIGLGHLATGCRHTLTFDDQGARFAAFKTVRAS